MTWQDFTLQSISFQEKIKLGNVGRTAFTLRLLTVRSIIEMFKGVYGRQLNHEYLKGCAGFGTGTARKLVNSTYPLDLIVFH